MALPAMQKLTKLTRFVTEFPEECQSPVQLYQNQYCKRNSVCSSGNIEYSMAVEMWL